MMSERLFETALGIAAPWRVAGVDLDATARTLTIRIDFAPGSRFAVPGETGTHPVHDTVSKRYRHLNFFQHECHLEVRVPRVKLPGGSVRQVEPDWAGQLKGFTLLFEALVLMLAREMPFAAVARLTGESWHRVATICERYVGLALAEADFSAVSAGGSHSAHSAHSAGGSSLALTHSHPLISRDLHSAGGSSLALTHSHPLISRDLRGF